MNAPILLALVALVAGGFVTFIWKIAGANDIYAPSYIMVSALCFFLVGWIIHLVQDHPFVLTQRMAALAGLGGILGGVVVFAMLMAFRLGGQGSILFPIAGLGVIVSVPLSLIVFGEPITPTKILGLVFAVTSIIVLTR